MVFGVSCVHELIERIKIAFQNSVSLADDDSESARTEDDPAAAVAKSPPSPSSPSSSGRKNDSGYIRPKEAVRTREFWILWLTRFCIVLCTQVRHILRDEMNCTDLETVFSELYHCTSPTTLGSAAKAS